MATLFRAPLFTLRGSASVSRVPHAAQADVWTNRISTLFVVPPKPFKQTDWPNPLRSDTRFPLDNRTEADGSEFWLLKDTFFGGPGQPPSTFAQPNPVIKAYPYPLRSFVQTFDFFAVLQAPFSQDDWPNPTPARFVPEHRTQADGTEFWLLAPATASPFSQLDWPTPRGATPAIDNRTEADGSEFWLLKDTFFGGAGQPPSPTPGVNPRGYSYAIDGRTWIQSHLLDTLAPVSTTAPFTPIDWPNPGLKAFPVEDRSLIDPSEFWLLKDTFFGGAGQPPTYLAQPNPRGYVPPADVRTWLQSLLTNTLAPTAPPASSINDWPNPRGYAYPLSLRTQAEFTRLLGKDQIFGGPGQPLTIWPQPNPLGYRYPLELRTLLARLVMNAPIPALDTSCFIQVLREPWQITVPADPLRLSVHEGRQITVKTESSVVDVSKEPHVVDPELN